MSQQANAPAQAEAAVPAFQIQSPGLYQQLTAPFDHYQHDKRGGASFDYITGEQCITRLNTIFGVGGWYFRVTNREIVTEADEVLVEGEMGAFIDGQWVVRSQFGSQKLKRSRDSGKILDVGFDFKGATTDCIKKCASLFGVALHLYEKEPAPVDDARPSQQRPARPQQQASPPPQQEQPTQERQVFHCQALNCLEQLKGLRFNITRDGKEPETVTWTASQLAAKGRRNHKMILCAAHYREASRAAREAQHSQSE